jgi:hypothetical protein
MTGREVAHVHHGLGEHRGLSHLTLREEPISDPKLIQHLDRARVKTAAREPTSTWSGRCSTTATSTFANANSAANIIPVGPPPAITTACSVVATLPFEYLVNNTRISRRPVP